MSNTKIGLSTLGVFIFLQLVVLQAKLLPATDAKAQKAVSTPSASPSPTTEAHKTIIRVGEPRVVTPSPKPLTIEEKIRAKFPEDPETAVSVAFCESSYNPQAKSKISSAKGLFQILDGTFKQFKCTGDPLNADDNIKCAKKIYNYYQSFGTSGGWEASKHCWSKGVNN